MQEGAPTPGGFTPEEEKKEIMPEKEGQEIRDQAEKQKRMIEDLKTVLDNREGKDEKQLMEEIEKTSLAIYLQDAKMKETLLDVITEKDENGEYVYTYTNIKEAVSVKESKNIEDEKLKALVQFVSPEAKTGEM